MIETSTTLASVYLERTGLTGGALPALPGLAMRPGQYLLAYAPALPGAAPLALFPSQVSHEWIRLAPPLPETWQVGTALQVRGPLGKGFHLTPQFRRVALAALASFPHRLLPLLHAALLQKSEVALYSDLVPPGLPPEVEVLPLSHLPEAGAWADYLALDLEPASLPGLRKLFGLRPHDPLPEGEALVYTPMPCGGRAECGVCAVPIRRGSWRLACKDGPVFSLKELEL